MPEALDVWRLRFKISKKLVSFQKVKEMEMERAGP